MREHYWKCSGEFQKIKGRMNAGCETTRCSDGGAVSQAHTSGYQHPPLRGSPKTQEKKPFRRWLDASRAATGSEQGKDGRERLAVGFRISRDWQTSQCGMHVTDKTARHAEHLTAILSSSQQSLYRLCALNVKSLL